MLKTKHAPRKASSKLLEKKWQEHNYLLHKYRLRAMFGDVGRKPNYHGVVPPEQLGASSNTAIFHPPPAEYFSPPQKRKAMSAHPRADSKSAVVIPTADSTQRPYTSKDRKENSRPRTTRNRSGANHPENSNQRGGTYPENSNQRGGTYPENSNQRGGTYPENSNQRGGTYPENSNQRGGTYPENSNQRSGTYPENSNRSGDRHRENNRPFTTRNSQRQAAHSTSNNSTLQNDSTRPFTTKGRNMASKPHSASGTTPTKGSARNAKSAKFRTQYDRIDSGRSDELDAERRSHPLSSKGRAELGRMTSARQPQAPPRKPMMQQWMRPKPRGYRPMPSRYKSEYSRDKLSKEYKKHQRIKNTILSKPKPKEAPPPKPSSSSSSDYSDQFEQTDSTDIYSPSDYDGEGVEYVPSPTPTPEPIKEVEKLDMDDENVETPPTPIFHPVVQYPKVEINYTPPSHVLKIVDDARDYSESDWSEDEPIYVLKDGQRGTFIRKDDKYYLAETVKDRRHKRKHKLNEKKSKETENGGELIKEVHYINYEADEESEEDQEDGEQDQKQGNDGENQEDKQPPSNDLSTPNQKSPINYQVITADSTTESETESEIEIEYDSDGAIIERPPKPPKPAKTKSKKAAVYINYQSSEDESKQQQSQEIAEEEPVEERIQDQIVLMSDDEMDLMDSDETDEENKEQLVVSEEEEEEEELTNLRPETVADDKYFDAKKIQDSDSDLDEFGRLKGRQRPSSATFDFLPPLKPDPRLDGGDITNCKNRLSRHVVIIREALARNEQNDLETAIDVIIANNNDNRRWLRKIYRDSYLQSLLLDLRKTLPADVASVVSYMMTPICEFDAMCLWDALKGLHKDPEVLSEILCTRTNTEMEQIRIAYALRYDVELIDHIEDETISSFQRMLMRLASGQREEQKEWTKEDCAREAKAISALLETRGEHCTKKLIEVFCQLPIEMLRCVINEYKKLTDRELDSDLIKTVKGNFQRCIVTIIHYIQNPPNYFVEKLHATHFGNIDDDKGLCRLIISRSEPEMIEMIKQLFILRYDMSLYDYIDQSCKGPIKGLVMRIVAGQLTDEERSMYDFPALWPGREDAFTMKRMTFDQLIFTLLRRSKVSVKMEKVLVAYQQQEESETECEESEEESVADAEEEDEEAAEQMNSEEEEEAEERAAAAELKNGLKNISFADDVEVENTGYVSIFKDISFANASRGILKNAEGGEGEENEEEEGGEGTLDENLADEMNVDSGNGPQLTQLNGPVHDPTFTGRGNQGTRIPFKKNKKKGPNLRATVQGIDMENFNALKDAQAIGKALLQKKRNIEGVLQFMTTRNNAQRQLIIREFFRRYRRDLVDDLRTLAPHLEEIAISLLLGNDIYAAACLYSGINGNDSMKCVDIMIEVLCTRQNDEIAIIKRAFLGVFGLSLHEEIENMTSGNLRNLLTVIVECQRDESDVVDEPRAKKDAQALYESIILRPPDLSMMVEIFAMRSFPHIAKTCEEFALIRKADVLEIIHEVTRGAFKAAVITLVCAIRDLPMYFCERIYKSMSYHPVDLGMLVRETVSRSEIDLVVIKAAFRRTYGRTIYSMIEKDTDYHAKKILLDVVKK